ncbi:hypothetical protein GOODEAATRI_015277 [Goodea atripinnis]|uniref:Uncharacterized protein n=1 Tax=Goodea atripinnis TaxID=208336 RepID=A0ABV0MS76_9TELE
MCKQSSWERTETTTSFLQRTAELTGFHRNNKEKIERQRGGGEVDLQIKLSSRPVKKPCSHISLCEGETRPSQKPSWLFLLALERNKKKKKRDGGKEKKAFPRTCSPLCLSQCRINPNQHTCQPDSYKRFPMLL